MSIQNTGGSKLLKIMSKLQWTEFQQAKVFAGTAIDIQDGYIHMCATQKQLRRVANKYYPPPSVFFVVQIDAGKLDPDKLKYEESSSNKDVYPHYYGMLPLESICEAETVYQWPDRSTI